MLAMTARRTFQLRYQGDRAPDPETLTAPDVIEARRVADARFRASGAQGAVLWSDGAVLHVFDRRTPVDQEAETAQLLAAAGVYVFRSKTPRA